METQNTERTEGIMAEATKVAYVEAARRGGHRWWRYLLGREFDEAKKPPQAKQVNL
jgi:hypothetical protein